MAVFKCKMCGGSLEVTAGTTVIECEYCGTKQTLPKLDDDRLANLHGRANHFRRNSEYDKAMGIYEQLLSEDSTDAEAYWSLVLCRYGIEYVEDPATHKRVPTINRAQFTAVYDDDNYKAALYYADPSQKELYEKEAKVINEIQKGILEISQKEAPFDVFICYKESDASGNRTPDSVLANDLYHQLVQEGFKVFFARITLEDKLGSAYEPYIFAALNSAKVMVVLGTKPEYLNATWVKNEWSRFLGLIKQGKNKILIPAYKDMDAYDLPDEFSHLQAQDMGKLGFMQDLIRGIKKLTQAEAPKVDPVKETFVTANANVAPLLERAFMFLEDGKWQDADSYCEKVLDQEPKNAEAYLGKLMANLHIKEQNELRNVAEPFDHDDNYQKAIRFAKQDLKTFLTECVEYIVARNEKARIEAVYNIAKSIMETDNSEEAYKEAAGLFESISNYEDAALLAKECYEKIEDLKKDAILCDATSMMIGEVASDYESAIKLLETIPGWRDADERIFDCKRKIEEIKEREEAARIESERFEKLYKRLKFVSAIVAGAIIILLTIWNGVITPMLKYNEAVALYEAGDVEEAYKVFAALGNYRDSLEKANAIISEYEKEEVKSANVGDYITFGHYEQDNNAMNGKEDIEWIVLDKQENKVLLISKYALDCQRFHSSREEVTWETCALRNWLNDDFINSAFSEIEKYFISVVNVPGENTADQVFLLSVDEVNKYFETDSVRQCEPTAYAVVHGVNTRDGSNCWWWLRSPGKNEYGIAGVTHNGCLSMIGFYAHRDDNAVRPAMWLETE